MNGPWHNKITPKNIWLRKNYGGWIYKLERDDIFIFWVLPIPFRYTDQARINGCLAVYNKKVNK